MTSNELPLPSGSVPQFNNMPVAFHLAAVDHPLGARHTLQWVEAGIPGFLRCYGDLVAKGAVVMVWRVEWVVSRVVRWRLGRMLAVGLVAVTIYFNSFISQLILIYVYFNCLKKNTEWISFIIIWIGSCSVKLIPKPYFTFCRYFRRTIAFIINFKKSMYKCNTTNSMTILLNL